MSIQLKHIAIIGSGNVATYMARLLKQHGYLISVIISRNDVTGSALADEVGAEFSKELHISSEMELVMLCINDDELESVSNAMEPGDYILCHCAGGQAIDVLSKHHLRAVAYPLQSIHGDTDVLHTDVPFLIEAASKDALTAIEKLLNHCGKKFHKVNSEQRLKYHLAAVFANNFTNAMLMATQSISQQHQLDFELLKPLISETFNRLGDKQPDEVQTGPAKRNDKVTLDKHAVLLQNQAELKLYQVISEYISKKFKV